LNLHDNNKNYGLRESYLQSAWGSVVHLVIKNPTPSASEHNTALHNEDD
jgi:hypothetical protein